MGDNIPFWKQTGPVRLTRWEKTVGIALVSLAAMGCVLIVMLFGYMVFCR